MKTFHCPACGKKFRLVADSRTRHRGPDVNQQVTKALADALGWPWNEIRGPKRHRTIVDARATIVRVLHDDFGLTYSAIGRCLNRDHSSIIHLYKRGPLLGAPLGFERVVANLCRLYDVDNHVEKLVEPVTNGGGEGVELEVIDTPSTSSGPGNDCSGSS